MGKVTFWMNPLLHCLHREAKVTTLLKQSISVKDQKLGELNMDHKTHNCAAVHVSVWTCSVEMETDGE